MNIFKKLLVAVLTLGLLIQVNAKATPMTSEKTHVFYKVDNTSPLNAPYFVKNASLPMALIDFVNFGNVEIYNENLSEKITGQQFFNQVKKTEGKEGSFHFLVGKTVDDDGPNQEVRFFPERDIIQLYYQTKEGKLFFIVSLSVEAFKEDFFPLDVPIMDWQNPFDFTDIRVFSEAIQHSLFEGKIVKVLHPETATPLLCASKKEWKSKFPRLDAGMGYVNTFDEKRAKQSKGQSVHRYNNCEYIRFTRFRMELTDSKKVNTFWQGTKEFVKNHGLRLFLHDASFKRLPNEVFDSNVEKVKTLEENAIGAYFTMNVSFSKNTHRFIIPQSGEYMIIDSCHTETKSFGVSRVTFYIKSKYTVSGKPELLGTLVLMEMVNKFSEDTPDHYQLKELLEKGDFPIQITQYEELLSGEMKSTNSKKNIKALKVNMGEFGEGLDEMLVKKNIKDF